MEKTKAEEGKKARKPISEDKIQADFKNVPANKILSDAILQAYKESSNCSAPVIVISFFNPNGKDVDNTLTIALTADETDDGVLIWSKALKKNSIEKLIASLGGTLEAKR